MTGQCSLWPVKSPFWPGIVCWLAIIFGNGLATILFSSEMQPKLTKWQFTICWPFKPQYPHTNSPNWSPYISLNNELREFDTRSRHFLLGDHFINFPNLTLGSVWILLGENWSWSLLGIKELIMIMTFSLGKRISSCKLEGGLFHSLTTQGQLKSCQCKEPFSSYPLCQG